MRKLFPLFLIAGSLSLPNFAMAWADPGHLTIAAEAYQQLPPQFKAQVFDLLKSHPNYERWQTNYHPNPVLDLPTTVFMRSATWPDEVRGSGTEYDHPNWHYVDYPLRPPAFTFEAAPSPTNDVLFGIAQCEATLSDTNASAEKRAASLSYLVHLVGDMHQPLHCESLYTDVYTNGDRGGNDFYVKPALVGIRLHGLWDGLLGSAVDRRGQWNYALELDAKFPRASLPELAANTKPYDWSLESRQLAIDYGYLHGNLAGSRSSDTAPALPADYTKNAKAVAERQAALAGYRLADEIQKYLKWSKDLPLLPPNTNIVQMNLPAKISVAEVTKYYDEAMVVTGKLVQVTENPNITFLKFEQPPTTPAFSAVIFRENTGPFGDLLKLTNHLVEVSGNVTEYHGRPELILVSTNQLKVLDGN